MNDPKNVWQSQPSELFHMPEELLRRRFDEFRQRSLMGLYSVWGLAGLVTAVSITAFLRSGNNLIKAACCAWIVWSCNLLCQSWRRGWRRHQLPDTPVACVQFYRSELVRERDYHRAIWKWFLAPAVPCLLITLGPVIIAPRQNAHFLVKGLPFLTLLAVWLVLVPRSWRQKQRHLQLEIDTVDSFGAVSDTPRMS